MTTDICGEEVIVRLSSPQIISTETIVAASSPNNVSGTGSVVASLSGARMQAGGVELGRRLLLAARAGDTAAVLDLMAKGAPFTTDWLGTSPLHLAAANDHADTCAVLLRAGVSRDSRTKVERTALHLAAHAGHARVVALLLDHGAAVDCRDMLRMTPLHWAAARGHAAAARELLRRGADVRARCKFRKTPRCLAARKARHDLVALLDAAEAQPQAQPPDQLTNETQKVEREFETIQRIQDIKPQAKFRIQPEKTIIIESKTEPVPSSMASAAASRGAGATVTGSNAASSATAGDSGAAALLRAHGITLLPADRGCTVLTALRSGRTVVLSDAGKLMLKESSNSGATTEPQIILNNTLASSMSDASVSEASATDVGTRSAGGASAAAAVRGAGAATVRAVRPGRNVKVVTLSKPHQPLKKIIHPSDLQQVKLVSAGAGGAGGAGGGARRPALKLLLNKVNLQRLLAAPASAATQAHVTSPLAAAATITQEVPSESMETTESSVEMEQDGSGDDSPRSLRQQLAAARAALAAMAAELRACRAKIALYEKQRPH